MNINGLHIIASEYHSGGSGTFSVVNPADGVDLDPVFCEATAYEVDLAVSQAILSFDNYRELSVEQRADFLDCIAGELQNVEKELISQAHLETALPHQRLAGELARTVGQLKQIAAHVRQGAYLGVRIDRAMPERLPQPKPDVRSMNVPLGPVAIFGASNFPLAFSVAGGDTVSALAAGCPVVVKGHPAHPGTGEIAGLAIMRAVKKSAVPPGVFSLIHAQSHDVSKSLVQHPEIKAVAFTGSLVAGRRLFDLAANRAEPVPVYAEMGSVNPVFILPEILGESGSTVAEGLAGSITMGVGQFCTAPGLVFVEQGVATELFLTSLQKSLDNVPQGTMLHPGIKETFLECVSRLEGTGAVYSSSSRTMPGGCDAVPLLYRTTAKEFIAHPELADEVFGPAAIVVVCATREEMLSAAETLSGQLTASVHGTNDELQNYRELFSLLECIAGRIVYNGFPTGVEVCPSMHHGGPYPATTDSRSTSVGSHAVYRFLRPVCYQNCPPIMLPEALRDK